MVGEFFSIFYGLKTHLASTNRRDTNVMHVEENWKLSRLHIKISAKN